MHEMTLEATALGFATLFLGLTTGTSPVRLMTAPPVAAVELRLDGAGVATLAGEPWTTPIDFGQELLPHELVAVGFDAGGREVARIRQWINMPQPEAAVTVVLERDADGKIRAARLGWASKQGLRPTDLTAELDGAPLQVPSLDRLLLPDLDMATAHVLRVSVAFGAAGSASNQVVLGGSVGEEARVELTAVPIVVREGGPTPTAQELQGHILVGGRPALVIAVEKGPVAVAAVVDPGTKDQLRRVVLDWVRREAGYQGPGLGQGDDRLYLVDPRPETTVDPFQRPTAVFPTRLVPNIDRFALLNFLGTAGSFGASTAAARLADAVAVAGVVAAGARARRAVILVSGRGLSGPEFDRSRGLLQALGVPLHVWSLRSTPTQEMTSLPGAESIARAPVLRVANARLQRELSRQFLVWVEGTHRPQDVTLDAGVATVALAR
jgi:hypothetical protein